MGTHMKRRSKRKSRKSRKRRAGSNVRDSAFKAKMGSIAEASAKTLADADKTLQAAARAKEDASVQMREARTAGLPSICRLDIMKGSKKCMKEAQAVEKHTKEAVKHAKVLKRTSQRNRDIADKLKAAGLSKLGGKRKRRRTKRRRKSRKSKKSRRKSRKTKRRRKSKKRRSRRRR